MSAPVYLLTSQVAVIDPGPTEGQRAAIEVAVRFCPTHALSLVDD